MCKVNARRCNRNSVSKSQGSMETALRGLGVRQKCQQPCKGQYTAFKVLLSKHRMRRIWWRPPFL
jgi:hypothetical protein